MVYIQTPEAFEQARRMYGIRNFSFSEFTCPCCGEIKISLELVRKVQLLRDAFGRPIRINSAYRCQKHNETVGGSPTSSHLKGLALDLAVSTSPDRFFFISKLLRLGIDRIGIGKDFLHFDLDEEKPKGVIWTYY